MKLREQAYESFRQHLLTNRIRPGQFVSQRELVALTGLPLGAIREMIPRLEADGLIVTIPQRGMQIASVDLKLVRNAFQLRAILEREAITQFTLSAGDAEIERFVRRHAEILARAEAGPITPELLDEAQSLDWGFHDALIDRLGNLLVSSVYRVNSLKIRLIRFEETSLSPAVLLRALHEHTTVLEAVAARDPVRAVQALDRHIDSARLRALGITGKDEHETAADAVLDAPAVALTGS
ncbi:MAG TPA: GntR family transcriptional regulator [Stellaceae bacterium]|nr:GntR family transcriptional regulator [Stellaceae bacterium]